MPIEPGSDEWRAKVQRVAEETTVPDGAWWYFSFADADLPKGTQFLGAVFVRGCSLPDAITRSHVLGINPGGEVASIGPIPDETAQAIPARFRERLMSREDVAEFDAEMGMSE